MRPFEAAVVGIGVPFLLVLLLEWSLGTRRQQPPWVVFLAGGATAFVALLAEQYVWRKFNWRLPPDWASVIRAFLMVALVEELVKLALIRGQAAQHRYDDFRDFAVMAATIGAGFAAAENLLYAARIPPDAMPLRLFTAAPMHIATAIIAARLIWLGMVLDEPVLLLAAVGAATLLHGAYDFLAMAEHPIEHHIWALLGLILGLAISTLGKQRA